MTRTKLYFIKSLDEKGMLNDPENYYGDRAFSSYGYESEEEVWEAIEKHMERSGRMYGGSYVVIQQFSVGK